MSVIDQKYQDEKEREAVAQDLQKQEEKLTAAMMKIMETEDGKKAMESLSCVLYGDTLSWIAPSNTTLAERIEFNAGMMDVYLFLIAHCVKAGKQPMRINESPLAYEVTLCEKQKDNIGKVFSGSKEGLYVLEVLRAGFTDASLHKQTPVVRAGGARWIVRFIIFEAAKQEAAQ